jgi:hypothetical protein
MTQTMTKFITTGVTKEGLNMDKKPISKTAIDWFIDNLPNRFKNAILNECGEEIKKAKAMEKEQIIQSHLFGLLRPIEMEATKQAEEYYNETYGEVH